MEILKSTQTNFKWLLRKYGPEYIIERNMLEAIDLVIDYTNACRLNEINDLTMIHLAIGNCLTTAYQSLEYKLQQEEENDGEV